jgi:hypothetical protein
MPRSRNITATQHALEPQGKAFIELARTLGCDESEERFNEALAKVARHKPLRESKKEPKRKKTKR